MEQQKKRGRPRKDPMIAAAEAPKKRGRPAGTRTKHRVTVQSVKSNWEQIYVDSVKANDALIKDYDAIINRYEEQASHLIMQCKNYEHQAIGYRSVTSYLENKIEQLIANSVRGN